MDGCESGFPKSMLYIGVPSQLANDPPPSRKLPHHALRMRMGNILKTLDCVDYPTAYCGISKFYFWSKLNFYY